MSPRAPAATGPPAVALRAIPGYRDGGGPPPPPVDEEPPVRERWRADLTRYLGRHPGAGRLTRALVVLETEGLWAIAVYRFGQWLREEASVAARLALKPVHAVAWRAMRLLVGIHLDPRARIGPGLYIGHSGGIWVAPETVIGRNCNLAQEVTIGVGGTVRRGVPRIGDRVWIGPKATVAGPIRVGDGAVIGANSLVVAPVPDDAVVVGVPARVLGRSGSGALLG